jgi:hypothetical protein
MEGRCDPPSFASAFLNHVYGNWVHLCFSRLAHPGSVPAQALQTMT